MNCRLALAGPAWVRTLACCLALLCAGSLHAAVITLVPIDASWRFLDNGSNQGTNWTQPAFADGAWPAGRAELGYGDNDEVTVVGYGGNANNKHITTYFRHNFFVTNAAYSSLTLKAVRDDGLIVYLNGREIFRNNLPAGPIGSSTMALSDIEGVSEFTFVSTNLSATLLNAGSNCLAAAIHQFTRSSTDISFALELTATPATNLPPTATLVTPTNGASFFAPADITLAATASDPNGPVSAVEFYNGVNLLGEASSAPFNLTWMGVTPGSYALRAVAVDPAGARGTSAVVNITVRANLPPLLTVLEPTNAAVFVAPATIHFAANASDPDGAVSRVEFYEGDSLLGDDTNAPYSLIWSNLGPGNYQFTVVAVDNLESRSEPQVIDVVVRTNTGPSVSLLAPTNGAVFVRPADVQLNAMASDADGAVTSVEFYANGQLLGSGSVQSMVWTNPPAGTFALHATATDDAGARATSAPVSITVRDNAAPQVAFQSPADGAVFVEPVDVTFVATASDTDGAVALLRLLRGTNLVGQSSVVPATFVVSNLAAGQYEFLLHAVDDLGATTTTSIVISVRTNATPSVELRFPRDGTVFPAPADILALAESADADGSIQSVELWEGTNKLSETSSSALLVNWTNVTAGSYRLYAVARDDKGASATSAVARVFVRVPALTRGPYLQLGTPDGMTIRWRTDLPTDSVVRYGTNAGALASVHAVTASATNHEVRLSGLLPDQRYYYSVGSTHHVFASGEDYSFRTTPARGGPMRIWVLGDSGTANADAARVRDAYYAFSGTNHTDLWLMLGDNAYCCGYDHEYQAAVFDMYPQMLRRSVLWPAIGNHDVYSADDTGRFSYLDIFSLPAAGEAGGVPSGTEKYYSFNVGNVHFVALDSMTVDRTTNGAMLAWLQQDLAANTNDWLVAYWHHPPYSRGSHDSDHEFELIEMRENALPILESYGVDLVLAGHSHSYERSYLLNGFYGPSDSLVPEMIKDDGDGRPSGNGAYAKNLPGPVGNQGAVYVVAGSSGQLSWGELNHPAMFISLLDFGSLVLDVHGHVMDVKFLRDDATVGDSFTLIKGSPTAVLQVTSLNLTNDMVTLSWQSVPGENYYIERSPTLLPPQWAVISERVRATSSTTRWTYRTPPGSGANFYRVVQFRD